MEGKVDQRVGLSGLPCVVGGGRGGPGSILLPALGRQKEDILGGGAWEACMPIAGMELGF